MEYFFDTNICIHLMFHENKYIKHFLFDVIIFLIYVATSQLNDCIFRLF